MARMRIDDATITRQLEQVRKRHGLDAVPFTPQPFVVNIDEDLTTIDEVKDLFHPSGLLVRAGQPVLAYIRDHTSLDSVLDPVRCKKVHFTVCATLKNMKTQGRFERYRITNRQTNRYLVDVGTAWGRIEERETKLYPCQNCLGNVKYHNFRYNMRGDEKRFILESFDVKEVFTLLHRRLKRFREQNALLRQATRNTKSAVVPGGYPANWRKISADVRRRERYTCGQCGVRLDEQPRLLDVHHVDGDKQNVKHSNLRCLCKLCHHREHPYYKVAEADRSFIEIRRARQTSLRATVGIR